MVQLVTVRVGVEHRPFEGQILFSTQADFTPLFLFDIYYHTSLALPSPALVLILCGYAPPHQFSHTQLFRVLTCFVSLLTWPVLRVQANAKNVMVPPYGQKKKHNDSPFLKDLPQGQDGLKFIQ